MADRIDIPNNRRQCFRCGKTVQMWDTCGQVTISGFYSHKKPLPYYSSYILCEDCHDILDSAIKHTLFPVDD